MYDYKIDTNYVNDSLSELQNCEKTYRRWKNYLDEISSPDTKDQLKSLQLNSFSVLHLNIRSMKKHFEAFQYFIETLNFKFNAICLSEN